jgi:hypothetical protein
MHQRKREPVCSAPRSLLVLNKRRGIKKTTVRWYVVFITLKSPCNLINQLFSSNIYLIRNTNTKAKQKVIPNKLSPNKTINEESKRHQYDTTSLDAPELVEYLEDLKTWLGSEDSAVCSNRVGVLANASVVSYCSNVRRFFVWLNVRLLFVCFCDDCVE